MIRKPYIFIALFIFLVSVLHYATPIHLHHLHEVYKVLYFIPIILSAFFYGFRGGLTASLAVTALYLPHVMFQWGGSLLMNLSRFLMIVLYVVLGSLTGYLWQREKSERQKYQQVSQELEKSLQRLKATTEEMMSIEGQLISAERLSTLGELTASLAHEVRNPLGSIRGVAEILRDEAQDSTHEKFVNILIKETNRLDQVVANYLEFARPQKNKKQTIQLEALINSVLTLLGPNLRTNEINVTVNLHPPALQIICLENQIRQVLLNVLLNAIQFSTTGGKIEINGTQTDKITRLIIRDYGQGFDEDLLISVFEPFFTQKQNGTGLGLAISKRIIEMHNGTIKAANAQAGGGMIIMEIPIG